MDGLQVVVVTVFLFAASLLYSSVGQAGASGYLAVMALAGIPPAIMKPTALMLNIVVASVVSWKFLRVGAFSWRKFWPFAAGSVPFALIGGAITLPGAVYKPVVGIILFYAAYRLWRGTSLVEARIRPIPFWAGLASGIAIGFLSGLTGVGGGIFISPLLLFMNWADARETAGISALFIWVNSVAGLLGNVSSVSHLPVMALYWAPVVAVGGYIGSEYGSRRFGNQTLKKLLAVVLVVGGIKMLLT